MTQQTKLTPEQIKDRLDQNTGTHHYYKAHNIHVTDGVKEMADLCEAYWLITIVRSCQHEPKVKQEPFQVYRLEVDTEQEEGTLTVTDGNENTIYTQEIPYTDFPLESMEIWFSGGVAYLPSEH